MRRDDGNPEASSGDSHAESLADSDSTSPYILPGGKVDGEAVRLAYIEAHTRGDEGFEVRLDFSMCRDVKDRLDRYLTSRITFMSRSQLQAMIEQGGAFVNGKIAKASTKLRINDQIEIIIPKPPSGEIEPDAIELDVLYEDQYLLVINKQPDIIVHPARAENRGTMLNALVHYFETRSSGGLSSVGEELARPGVVHRLDRNTSGCIVFAKDDQTHWKMGQLFQDRKVDKRYLALVQGWVERDEQFIDLPLGPHLSRAKGAREKRVVRFDDLGKPSKTICRVRERYALPGVRKASSTRKFTLVELELLTGRTHQIRVHLSHLGHPIVGDDMYGGKPMVDGDGTVLIDRQALHAGLLGFDHPITGEVMVMVAPPRDELLGCIEYLRSEGNPSVVVPDGVVSLARFGL